MNILLKITLSFMTFLMSINTYALDLSLRSLKNKQNYIVDFSDKNPHSARDSTSNKYNLPSFKVDDNKTRDPIPYDLSDIEKRRFIEATTEIEKRLKKRDLDIPLTYENLDPQEKAIAESVRNLSMLGLAMFAILWSLPEDITKWDSDREISDVLDQWSENVSEGPVKDEDEFAINYIGHPLSGAYQYLFLRNKGFSRLESFGFSIFVSTFMWEYGIEAFAEVPSIQDLILTPLVGSLMGELFHKWDEKLKKNDYVLWNSRRFGRIIHHIINPVEGINNVLNNIAGLRFLYLKNASFFISANPTSTPQEVSDQSLDEKNFGIRFVFEF